MLLAQVAARKLPDLFRRQRVHFHLLHHEIIGVVEGAAGEDQTVARGERLSKVAPVGQPLAQIFAPRLVECVTQNAELPLAQGLAELSRRVGMIAGDLRRARELLDVVLADFNLGEGMDGLMLIEKLRERHPNAHYALVTAARAKDYMSRAGQMGVTVLRKPATPAVLNGWLSGTVLHSAAE